MAMTQPKPIHVPNGTMPHNERRLIISVFETIPDLEGFFGKAQDRHADD
jgi:hypothetical protein